MSSADLAVLVVAIATPVAILAREIVRRSRGEHIDDSERRVILGGAAVGVAAILILRSPEPRILLSVGLIVMGLYLIVGLRRPTGTFLPAFGAGTVILGLVSLVIALGSR